MEQIANLIKQEKSGQFRLEDHGYVKRTVPRSCGADSSDLTAQQSGNIEVDPEP